VLLKANDITVESEHVVDTLVFEVLNVDGLVLRQLDQVAHNVLLRNGADLLVLKTHVKSVETHGLLLVLEGLVHEGIHQYHVDFAQGVPSLQRHVVVQGFREQDLHVVSFCQFLNSRRDL
jgi:hypothetical protein